MPPVRSKSSTHYRAVRKLRKQNGEMIRKLKKIQKTQNRHLSTNRTSTDRSPSPQATDLPPQATTSGQTQSIQQDEVLQLLFTFITKHGLTKSCMPDFLDLTRLLMGDGAGDQNVDCLQSVYKLKKALEEDRKKHVKTSSDVTFHHYCEKCDRLFKEEDTGTTCGFCHHPRYDSDGKPHAVFMEMNPSTQIQDFFRDKHFVDGIGHRFKRLKADPASICDVYDGELYRKQSQDGGFLANPWNLSLIWHTDGVSIFKSSSMQAWPVQSTICELPPNKRFSKDYVLIHGLWFGKNKPTMSTYLQPIIATMNDLRNNGIPVQPYGSDPVTCKVCSLACTMDLPAAAAVKEMHQWNGSHGCFLCEEPGTSVGTGKRGGNCRVYRFPEDEPTLRTDERLLQQVADNLETGKVTKGVKGFSALFELEGANVAESFLVDYLHGVCLGVMKRMFKCWFDKKREDFYIGDRIPIINERLMAIKTPSQVHRPPRKLEERVHYKASEYRNFLLYYGLHVTKDVLPSEYHIHFGMLVRAIHVLLSRSITPQELGEAKQLLKDWYSLVEAYYGIDQCTINVHNVGLHLVRCVELGGPLWAFSCFFFESMCGQLARMVKGTQEVPKQMLSGIRTRQFLKRTTEESQNNTVNNLLRRDKRNLVPLGNGFFRIGKVDKWKRPKAEVEAVRKMDRTLAGARGTVFWKVERRGEVYHSERTVKLKKTGKKQQKSATGKKQQKSATRRANHYVVYKHQGSLKCGTLKLFIHLKGLVKSTQAAIIMPLDLSKSQLMSNNPRQLIAEHVMMCPDVLTNNFMHGCYRDGMQLEAIPINNIVEPFIFLPDSKTEGECAFMPTVFEHD